MDLATYSSSTKDQELRNSDGLIDLRKVTFVDTPGQDIFYRMRNYGASVADVGLLVLDVEEGVRYILLCVLSMPCFIFSLSIFHDIRFVRKPKNALVFLKDLVRFNFIDMPLRLRSYNCRLRCYSYSGRRYPQQN